MAIECHSTVVPNKQNLPFLAYRLIEYFFREEDVTCTMYTAAYNRSPVTEDSEQTNKVDTVCDALRKALIQEDENK